MTAREYAKQNGIEIVGKLTKKTAEHKDFDYMKCEYVTRKTVYYIDEAGNEFLKGDFGGWCAITADGACI